RDRVVRAFQVLGVDYKVPISCVEIINTTITDEDFQYERSDDSDSTMALSSIEFLNLA
ncbi:hypothetical protein PPYR_08533, partial [Photinus pyralis]